MPPFARYARLGVNTIRSSQARTLLKGTPVGLSARPSPTSPTGHPPLIEKKNRNTPCSLTEPQSQQKKTIYT